MKKTALTVLAAIMLLLGIIWFFQGIGVIKGSFMTGTSQWTIIGLIMIVGAIPVYRFGRRA